MEEIKVKTVTYGRKRPIGRHGNAEYILTTEMKQEQAVEDVMASLRKMVDCQLSEIENEDITRYEEVH